MSKKSLEFHIKSSDYFGTLATVLSLIKQTSENNKKYIRIFENIVKDLMYLQNNYKIVKKYE